MLQKPAPIITHVEIYARAIRNLLDEIEVREGLCKSVCEAERGLIADRLTSDLYPKLDALKDMYLFESGTDYV